MSMPFERRAHLPMQRPPAGLAPSRHRCTFGALATAALLALCINAPWWSAEAAPRVQAAAIETRYVIAAAVSACERLEQCTSDAIEKQLSPALGRSFKTISEVLTRRSSQ
jgi:hypothetical protein